MAVMPDRREEEPAVQNRGGGDGERELLPSIQFPGDPVLRWQVDGRALLAWGRGAWHRARVADAVIDRKSPATTFGYSAPGA